MGITLSKLLSISIAIGLVGVALTGVRFFPFSNYPMFADAKMRSTILTVFVIFPDGRKIPIDGSSLYPFSRLHLQQMVRLAHERGARDEDWLEWIFKRVRQRHARAVAIEVGELTLISAESGVTGYQLSDFNVLKTWPPPSANEAK